VRTHDVSVGSSYAHPGMVPHGVAHVTPFLIGMSLDEDARDDFEQFDDR
jgi:hypothetical protein